MEKNTALVNLTDAHTAYVQAQLTLGSRVRTAKLNGASWAEIAAILGITRQAAQQKYGHSTPARNTSRDDQYTPEENAKADEAFAVLSAVPNTDTTPATPSIFLAPEAPAKAAKPSTKVAPKAPALKKWTPESAMEDYIDRRPMFHLDSAGFVDGVAQPGTGKGPHNCPRCSSTNHKGDRDLIRAFPGECKPTKYDPRDIAQWLTGQPSGE